MSEAYCQTITISNPSRATVEASFRAGSSDRWTVSPTTLVLKPQQSVDVDVRLRILKFAQKHKAVQQGQRDIFHIKAAYFEQKFYATFFLTPDALPSDSAQRQRRSGRTQSADSHSPANSPRDLLAAQSSTAPPQHPPAEPPHPTQGRQRDSPHIHSHAIADAPVDSIPLVQDGIGHSEGVSTPDLSPRGDMEAEDPPTPRMYKAIIPTAASNQTQGSARVPESPRLRAETSQVVLHQGHYDQHHDSLARQHASPQRQTQHKGPEQAIEDLRRTVRHALTYCSISYNILQPWQRYLPYKPVLVIQALPCKAEKDMEIGSLRSELAAAKHRISMDARASKVLGQIDTAGMSLQTQSQVEMLEAANARLEGSNAELRERLHELAAQAEAAQAQAIALQGLQASLQDSAGPSLDALVEAALGRERALQDARNRKVLELLNNKKQFRVLTYATSWLQDEVIQRFEDRCTEANADIQRLQAALQDATKRLETADNRLSSTIESRNKLRKQVEAKHAEMTSTQASLQADIGVLQDKLQEASSKAATRPGTAASPEQGKLAARLRAELEVHKEALQAAKEETANLASSLEKANSLIESLSTEVESKDADLQALQDRCQSKDEQVAAMGQQVERLESIVEAHKQADHMPHQHAPSDWAVNVSLDQGVGLGPPHMMPSSPTALRRRVQTLEAANEKLERALMAAHKTATPSIAAAPVAGAQGGYAAFEATINSLRSLLSDREHHLSRLEADLAIAKAYSGSSQRLVGESAQGESALKIELGVLRQRLSEKEAQIVNGEERLSRLEAVHRVAQETALRSESQLESTRRSLIELDEDKQAGKEEAESARLNARVSELILAAECARTDAESARAELHRVPSRHDSEIQALEKRQKQLVSALKAVGGQAQPLALAGTSETSDPGPAQPPLAQAGSGALEGASDALLAVRDRNQSQAIQEAELAVAVMQAKLLEAVAGQREATRQLQEAQQTSDSERAHLEQLVRRSKEEGSVRIQTLEETIRKLGNRSDLHQELARLAGEASFLRRTEARLKSNLGFAEDKTNELQREVTILRQQVASYEASEHEAQLLEVVQRSVASESSAGGSIAAKMNEFSRELSNEGSQPHIVARLVERAEASEVQLAQVQQELRALKQVATARAAAEGAGTSAAMSAAQVLEERAGETQRQLLLAQSELKAAREDAHIHELNKSQLQAQLAEASREVATAQSRVAEKERSTYDSDHVAAQRDAHADNDRWKEAADAARQKADAERRAESSQAAQQEAEQNLRMAQLEVTRLKASLEAKTKAARRADQAALRKAEHAEHELAVARRECERAAGDAEDRKVQLSVLVETVETLQAGTPGNGEKDQRIVSLTAQLTTARMKESVSERRSAQLQCELEEQATKLHKVQVELDKAEHLLSEKDTESAIGKAAAEAAARNISALRGELKAHADAAAKAAREVDDARNAAAKAEAEAAGLRAAVDAARTRHFEQLTKERAEAAAAKRDMRPSVLQASSGAVSQGSLAGPLSLVAHPSSLSLAAGIDDLVTALKPRRSSGGAIREDSSLLSVSGDDDTPHRVVQRMKAMLLEAQAGSAKAEADMRIAAAEAASLINKVRPLELALERRTNEWEAAKAELEASVTINAARQVQISTHAEQHISLQGHRVAALTDQLEEASSQATQLSLSLKHAHAQESAHKWQRDALQRKLALCEGDIQTLEAKLSAAHMEAAGTAEASRSQSIEAAIHQRDSDIRAYFDTHVLKHVLNPDHQKRALALTREICALKVAHQQLIAAHAAAKKLAGAASLQSVTLRQQLQVVEEQQAAMQEAKPGATSGRDATSAESSAAAQLASKAREMYRSQEELLQQRQKLALQEIQVREQLATEFASERNSLLREVALTREQHQEALAQAQKEAAASRQEFAEQLQQLRQQSQAALDACPTAEQYNQVVDTANAVQQNTQEMEAECSALQAENTHLQSVVTRLEVQVNELQADVETRSSALESLEGTLTKIERSVDSGRDRSPLAAGVRRMSAGKGSMGGSRPGTAGGLGRSSATHSDGALAALSRQLVQAKMAEADAQRKHRVSARAELSLRQRLSQREDRISELKDALAAAKGQQSGDRYAPQATSRPHSPRPFLTSTHNQAHPESYPRRAAPPLGDSFHHSRHKDWEQHPALGHENADEEDASHARQSPRSRAAPEQSHVQHGAAAHNTNLKLPYFQPKSAEPAQTSLAASQQAPMQQAAVAQAASAVKPESQAMISNQDPSILAQSICAVESSNVTSGVTANLRSPRGYASPQQLSEQVSDLKIELARRDAEVEYLEAQLAEAVAAHRPHTRSPADRCPDKDVSLMAKRAEELEASLARLQRECNQAVTAAQAVVGRPSTPRGSPRSSDDGTAGASVEDVVRHLIAKLKDRDASLTRLRAVAKSTAERVSKDKASAAAQPLEASQRAVIRDLSLRVANLTRGNNQLKEERERAQERLRTLRASLGSVKAPLADDASAPHQLAAPPTPAHPRGTRQRVHQGNRTDTPPHSRALAVVPHHRRITADNPKAAGSSPRADANGPRAAGQDTGAVGGSIAGSLLECQAVQGLCQLLEHHLAVLEQSQTPLGDLLQPAPPRDGPDMQQLLESQETLVSHGAKQALAAVTVAASAELAAMRSTLQVLSSHLDALQAQPAALAGKDQTAAEGSDSGSFLEAVDSPRRPMLALPAPPACSRQTHQEQAAQTLPVSLSSLSPEASTSQDDVLEEQLQQAAVTHRNDDVLAEQMQQAADHAQKWKGRCAKLRQELMETQTAAASLEAALNERLAGLEKSSEDLTQLHRKEVSRLEAALAGAEAAKKTLSEQQARHSTAGETDLQAAQAAQAEADARASSLQRQIDTLRAQAAASRSGLQEEANSLKAALSKEKSERARIVLSLRDTITGLKQAGDVEGRLKADLVQTHEDLATSRAAQEQLEARLTQKRSEIKSLNVKLEAVQRKLSQRTSDAELASQQTSLTTTHAQQRITQLESQVRDSSTQMAELKSRSVTADAECKSAKESCEVMEKEVARLDQLNKDLKATCQQLQATVDDLSRERQECASAKWEALLRSRRHRAAVHQMRGDLQAAESENRSLSEELDRARVNGQQTAAEAERLQKRVEDLQHFSDMERQQLAERHVSMMSDLERTMEEEREALRQEAAAMAASAAAAGEDRARNALAARLNEAQQSAFQDITNVANERRQLSDELESLRSQFKAYQRVKTREISSLDHRVRILLQSQAVAGTMRPDLTPLTSSSPRQKPLPSRYVKKTPAERYGKPMMVPSSDSRAGSDGCQNQGQGLGSASDEEDTFPPSYQPPLVGLMSKGKMQCASLTAAAEVGIALESEAVASAVREADFERMQREAAEAGIAALHDALEKLKQKLKSTQRDVRSAKDLASSSAAHAAGVQASQQELQQLQEQLVASQEALRAAKTESARRLKTLQSLQQQVDDLEAALRAARAADHSVEVQAAESRARSLQASLSRKEDTIRELRERMDQACRAAADKGAQEEAERQLAVVKKLKAEVTRKEGMLKATQAELDKARQEASEAAAAAEEAGHRDVTAQHHAGSSLTAVKERARAVLDALRALTKLALRTSAAMQSATCALQTASHPALDQEDVNAAAVARMVDMSLEEVADLLGGASPNGPAGEDSALLAKQVAQTLLELEAGLMTSSGKHAAKQCSASEVRPGGQALEDMLEGLQHQASRAEAMLAEAVRTANEQKTSGRNIAAHHSKRKKKAAHDPVMRLEEDLLRASHGIEAELYEQN
ncbi:hypothetical protein ABBQ38_014099 [Trebouxia sp. C0009 RCD-2024]